MSNGLGFCRFRLMAAIAFLMLPACMQGTAVYPESGLVGDVRGNYTLILYGGNYSDDLETIAFLDKEDDPYKFEPYAPDFLFRVKKGMTAERALREASEFIHLHPDFQKEQLRTIKDEKGMVIGHELRPLYFPLAFGSDDVLEIDYRLKEEKLVVYVRPKPFIERRNKENEHQDR